MNVRVHPRLGGDVAGQVHDRDHRRAVRRPRTSRAARGTDPPAVRTRAALEISPCFFYGSGAHRHLHSFPTRRSSDLVGGLTSSVNSELGPGAAQSAGSVMPRPAMLTEISASSPASSILSSSASPMNVVV